MDDTQEEATSTSYENDTQMETEQAVKERRAKLAAQRREQILAQMAKAQKSFITSNAEHFQDYEKAEEDSSMEWQSAMEEHKTTACIGADRKIVHNDAESFTCILCSEESTNNRSCMVYPAFIQKSNVLGHHKTSIDDIQNPDTDVRASPYINSCGHEMHVACWQEYFNNEMLKENRRPFRTRNPSIFNIEKKQFLCPLCRFLSNSVLPLIPPLSNINENKIETKSVTDSFNFDLWYQLMTNYINSLQFIGNDVSVYQELTTKEELQKNYQDCVVGFLKEHCNFDDSVQDEAALSLNNDINKYSKDFIASVKKISPTSGEIDDLDLYTYAMQTCSYTIEALEMYMRATDKPLSEMSVRYEKCVTGIIRLCGYYGRMNFELLKVS
jgi:E3 ubiquitin-protein ligase UBR2